MPWYDDHIEYGEEILRPYLIASGMEVHKIHDKLEQGHIPQQIVQEFNQVHKLLGEVGEDSNIDVEDSEGFENPQINVAEVEAALAYAEEHPNEIQGIIREERKLQQAQMHSPKEAYEKLNQLDLEYYKVEATLSWEEDEPVVEFQYSQP